MTNHTESVRLGDFLTLLTDYHANGSYERLKEKVVLSDKPDYAEMIRTTNFEKGDFVSDLKYISKSAYEFLSKSKVKPGDILMNKIANPGSSYHMPDLGKPVSLAMNLFLIRTDENHLNQCYAYYWLKANEHYVKGFACGAATATITKAAVRGLEIVNLPDLATQRRIAEILSSYDELIANNLRRIRVLEEIARSICREWFIHFRHPGHESAYLDAPDHGSIPNGWESTNLGQICSPIRNKYDEGLHAERPLLDLSRMPSNSLAPTEYGVADDLTTSRILFEPGDTLFGSIRPYLHKVCRASLGGVTNISVFVLRARESKFSILTSIICSSNDVIQWADTHSSGTKMPVIKWEQLREFPILLPPTSLLEKFNSLVSPMLDQLAILSRRNQNLRHTRNLLLPRLLSSESTLKL
jgi:type I restriction enzyme S subunit